jgi:ankyrin repeat protein
MTPLLAAAENGHTSTDSPSRSSTVKVLLLAGADVRAKNKEVMTAVMLAAKGGHTVTVKKLHAFHVELNDTCELDEAAVSALKDPELYKEMTGANTMMFAAKAGHTETVQVMHSLGLSADARCKSGSSALHFAAKEGQLETVCALLALSADLNVSTVDGFTAIHCAALN